VPGEEARSRRSTTRKDLPMIEAVLADGGTRFATRTAPSKRVEAFRAGRWIW